MIEGEVPERSNGAVSKTVVPFGAPGVRIPPSPPDKPGAMRIAPGFLVCVRVARLVLLSCFLCGPVRPAAGQVYEPVYRPPGVAYSQQESEHFRIIFEQGLEAEAAEAAAVLESTLPPASELVGLRRRLHLPVVLNGFNDRSNGYVTPLPFRQEVEGARMRGQALSPRPPSWMAAVMPHELVHAAHAEAGSGFGLGGMLRPFAPDVSRAVNFMVPPGFAEGAAVYLENEVYPGGGRLDYALFAMRFRASMLSDDPWSIAQLLEAPAYTYPLDRHYHAGYLFAYMAGQERLDFFPRARRAFHRVPVPGFGWHLWYGARRSPQALQRAMHEHYRRRFTDELDALGALTRPAVVASSRGVFHRRPRWLDDRTLLAYVSGYDVRPGFYRIDAVSGDREPAGHHRITEDYAYHLDADTASVLFARYVADPLVSIRWLAEVFRLDLGTGRARRLTGGGRLAAPTCATEDGVVWAIRNEGQFNQWVRVDPGGRVAPVTRFERAAFVSLAPEPGGRRAAVLLNVAGRQGIFEATVGADGQAELEPWVLFDDASVYDVGWSSDGRYLLFAADPGGIANIFAYDLGGRALLKLTNVPFGALEPTLSPDGRQLVYAEYRHERFDLVRIPFDPSSAEVVPADAYDLGRHIPWRDWLRRPPPTLPDKTHRLTPARPYRALEHLAPRLVSPLLRYDPDDSGIDGLGPSVGLGLTVAGADPLETWVYDAAGYHQHGRLWGRLRVATGASLLRPALHVFDEPTLVLVQHADGRVEQAGREERGASLSFSLPVTLASNVYASRAWAGLTGTYRQDRLFERGGSTLRGFRDRVTLSPSALVAIGVQSNLRDLVPNTGVVLTGRAKVDVSAEGVAPERWSELRVSAYLPLLTSVNGGLRLDGGMLRLNRGALLNPDAFVSRGFDDTYLGEGTFVRYGVEYVQPLRFVDDGLLLVPLYLQALYGFTFAERTGPLGGAAHTRQMTAIGAGMGLRVRVFHRLDVDLRLGLAYRLEENDWVTIYR